MLQPKDTDWLNGHKNKTHIKAVYKKPTSDLKTHINWKWENWNCIKHLFWPQGYEIRYQLQEIKTVKNTNTWRLNNSFLNNQQVTVEIKKEIKKFLETNDNENMTTQNLCDAAKAVLRGKFIAIQSYLKK